MSHPFVCPDVRHVFTTSRAALAALADYDATAPAGVRSYKVERFNPECPLTGFCVWVERNGWRSGWLREA